MKILRKGDEFVKMNDKTMEDIAKIDSMIERGYKFSPKKDYKDFYKAEKSATEAKKEVKEKEKKEKKTKK